MEALLTGLPQAWLTFLLVLSRCAGFIIATPVLGARQIPRQIRILMILFLAIAIAAPLQNVELTTIDLNYAMYVGGELLFGLAIGMLITMTMASIQLGGELIDYAIGLGFMQISDPLTNENTSVLAQVKFILATLMFMVINGHLTVIRVLGESFFIVPPGGAGLNASASEYYSRLGGALFLTGAQIAAPLYVSMLTINTIEGILARTVPQINILIAGFPIRILTGMIIVLFGISLFFTVVRQIIEAQPNQLLTFIGLTAGI